MFKQQRLWCAQCYFHHSNNSLSELVFKFQGIKISSAAPAETVTIASPTEFSPEAMIQTIQDVVSRTE